jgi:hypothetical protein
VPCFAEQATHGVAPTRPWWFVYPLAELKLGCIDMDEKPKNFLIGLQSYGTATMLPFGTFVQQIRR